MVFTLFRIRARFVSFGPLGSGSCHQQAKKLRKTLILTVTSKWLSISKTDVNKCTVPITSNKQKPARKKITYYLWHLKSHRRKDLDPYAQSCARIQNFGSVSKCHGSGNCLFPAIFLFPEVDWWMAQDCWVPQRCLFVLLTWWFADTCLQTCKFNHRKYDFQDLISSYLICVKTYI